MRRACAPDAAGRGDGAAADRVLVGDGALAGGEIALRDWTMVQVAGQGRLGAAMMPASSLERRAACGVRRDGVVHGVLTAVLSGSVRYVELY